jgi:hypothetical protein
MNSDGQMSNKVATILLQGAGIVLFGAVGFFVLKSVRSSQPRIPDAAIPQELPREEYRVFHPGGFSIVRPAYWDSKVGWSDGGAWVGGIELVSPYWEKPTSMVMIAGLRSRPRLRGQVRSIQFQGHPAQMTVERRPDEWGEHPGQLTVELAFERDSSWWLLRYYLFREQQDVPDVMWKYFETFSTRVPSRPAGSEGSSN